MIALLPYRRITAMGVMLCAGSGCLISGLIILEHPLRSFPLLLGGVLFLGIGAMLWELE